MNGQKPCHKFEFAYGKARPPGAPYRWNARYTQNLTTSYKGQLLEITFTSNLNTSPELKAEIDHIMNSVHLEE